MTAVAATASTTSPDHHPRKTKTRIDLNEGAVDGIGQAYRTVIGPRTLVVSAPPGRPEDPHVQRVLARLRGVGIQCGTFSMLERYPTTQAVDEGAMIAKRMGAQSVVGVGGGSVLDLAKGVAALACTRADGGSREHLRVFHKEKELPAERLNIVVVPTTASTGGGALGPQSLVLYEPEEALVPLHAKDLAPDVAVVDPTLFASVPPQMQLAQGLSALSVCFDALACGSARGALDVEGMRGLIVDGATALGQGLHVGKEEDAVRRRRRLAEGSMAAGQLLGLVEAPPVQSLARCLAPLFPLASYSQLTTVLLRSYLAVLADRQQQGDLGADAFNEALLRQLAAAVCPAGKEAGLLEMAEWVWEESQRAGIRTLADYRASDKEEKTAEALATQVSSVLALFHVEGGETLDAEVVRDVIEVSLGT